MSFERTARFRLAAALLACAVGDGLVSFAGDMFDADRVLRMSQQRHGPSAAPVIRDWTKVLGIFSAGTEQQKLRDVNEYFNRKLRFADDVSLWGTNDYWTTPIEALLKGGGDCEDFAIAKYVSLNLLGVPASRMRITYVKASIGGASSPVTQAHMVLAYYPKPDAEPLILDNLVSEIRPAARRRDLVPVFSFNSAGVFDAAGEAQAAGSRLSRWNDLVEKLKSEGIE